MSEAKHMPTPISYVAGDSDHTGALWCKTHCIADVDLSPEWAALIVRAVNSHAELVAALKLVRFNWAGHAEECAFVKTRYRDKCDCDWPKIAAQIDAALARAKVQP